MRLPTLPHPKVLAFDVFGTVVDWHSGIAREVAALRPGVDGDAFALDWRAGCEPARRRVMSAELGLTKRAGLPWDCILSAELFRAYKPDPATYLGVANVFDLSPAEAMLVAAHQDDRAGAPACGLQSAYIERATEFGATRLKDVSPDRDNRLHATDLLALADQLDC